MAQVTVSKNTLLSIADSAGIYEEGLRLDYSGRGMFDSECVGIVGNVGDLIGFVSAAVRQDEYNQANDEQTDEAHELHEFLRHIEDVSSDSMGYDSIFYWTAIECSDRFEPDADASDWAAFEASDS